MCIRDSSAAEVAMPKSGVEFERAWKAAAMDAAAKRAFLLKIDAAALPKVSALDIELTVHNKRVLQL
eukprot:4874589-Pyramimonas_sp.AAC.1